MEKLIKIVGSIPTYAEENFNVLMKNLETYFQGYKFQNFRLDGSNRNLKDELSRGILPNSILEGNPEMVGLFYTTNRPQIKDMKLNIINPLKSLQREYGSMVFGVTPSDSTLGQFKTNNLSGIYVEDFIRENGYSYKKPPVIETPKFELF